MPSIMNAITLGLAYTGIHVLLKPWLLEQLNVFLYSELVGILTGISYLNLLTIPLINIKLNYTVIYF